VAGTIVREIARLAMEGQIKPGEKFPPVAELAESWKVGRSSVREALGVFQTLGVTEAKPGRGTILVNTAPLFALIDWSQFTRAEFINDIIEARLVLEPILASMAAKQADEDGIRAIEQTLEAGRRAIGDQVASVQAALDFHTAVAEASGNRTLLLITQLLRSLYMETARNTRRYTEDYKALLADHEKILNAIRNTDVEGAAKASEEHMKHGLKLVVDAEAIELREKKATLKKRLAKSD